MKKAENSQMEEADLPTQSSNSGESPSEQHLSEQSLPEQHLAEESLSEQVPDETFYVRVTGIDRPGILTSLLAVLSSCRATVRDIEQITVRQRMILGLIVSLPADGNDHARPDLFKDLLFYGWQNDLNVEFEVADPTHTKIQPTYAVTLLGRQLTATDLRDATNAIAEWGGNIHRIIRLSRKPVFSYELHVQGGDLENMRKELLSTAASHPRLDIAFQMEGIVRRAKRLVAMDMDSTLIQNEVIDLLAEEAGCVEEVSRITERAVTGELDFTESLLERVAHLEGLDEGALGRAWKKLKLTTGAQTFLRTLHRLGYRTAVVSGGFTFFTDRLAEELGVDFTYANELEIVDGCLTGRIVGPVVDRRAKAEFLRDLAAREAIPLAQTVAVGDGANDLDMLEVAGLGIAFCASRKVREAADTSLNVPFLDAVLYFLGLSRQEIDLAGRG